jgi:hypothetical protein
MGAAASNIFRDGQIWKAVTFLGEKKVTAMT